jgi:hypothetical protein
MEESTADETRIVCNNMPTSLNWPSCVKGNPGITLNPGNNEVPQKQIDWIENISNGDGTKGDKSWKFYLRKKHINFVEVENEAGETVPAKAFAELGSMNAESAIDMVENTHDMEALRSWALTERRKGVSKAIEKKIAEMTPQRRSSE